MHVFANNMFDTFLDLSNVEIFKQISVTILSSRSLVTNDTLISLVIIFDKQQVEKESYNNSIVLHFC